jgi:urease alpha subunit
MWIYRRYLAVAGRSIHTYHTEDAGGRHAHGTMKLAGEKNIRLARQILLGHLLFIR